VYISDSGSNRFREVSNGIITTIAGTGPVASEFFAPSGYNGDDLTAAPARLSGPNAMAADSWGNVYFSDASNRVRVIIPQRGFQSDVSLSASPNFLPPGLGTTTLSWIAPPSPLATELHVSSPGGTLFADGGSSGSGPTGDWATAGMTFYLLDSGTKQILVERTILSDTPTVSVSPAQLTYGSPETVTVTWNAPSSLGVEIHVGSPTGTLFTTGGSSGSADTGNWAAAGMSFHLVDAITHKYLASVAVAGQQ
jgi:hypothetical protein